MRLHYPESENAMSAKWSYLVHAIIQSRAELEEAKKHIDLFCMNYIADLHGRMPEWWLEEHSIHIEEISSATRVNDDGTVTFQLERPDLCHPLVLRQLTPEDVFLVKRIDSINTGINAAIAIIAQTRGYAKNNWKNPEIDPDDCPVTDETEEDDDE